MVVANLSMEREQAVLNFLHKGFVIVVKAYKEPNAQKSRRSALYEDPTAVFQSSEKPCLTGKSTLKVALERSVWIIPAERQNSIDFSRT